jgi:hypothetical protein
MYDSVGSKVGTSVIAIAVAFIALIVAVYAIATMPKPYQPPPTASATVKLANQIAVDYPGTYTVNLGWIYVANAPAVVQLSANYTYIWFLIDGKMYSNVANVLLAQGNHTVAAIVSVARNGTKINISYNVVG